MKKLFIIAIGIILWIPCPIMAASNPAAVIRVADVATAEALGIAAPQYPYLHISNPAANYTWNGASTVTPDGQSVIQATGITTGRYLIDRPTFIYGNTGQSLTISLANGHSIQSSNLSLQTGGAEFGDPIHIGTNADTDSDAQIVVARSVIGTGGNGHAFADSSVITRSGTIGYNSFDQRILVSGASNYDHFAGFQCIPTLSTSGTTSDLYCGFANLVMTQGHLNKYEPFQVFAPALSGGATVGAMYPFTSAPASGNWGIGTLTPTWPLQVVRAASADDGNIASFGVSYNLFAYPNNGPVDAGYNVRVVSGSPTYDRTDANGASWFRYNAPLRGIETYTAIGGTAGAAITPIPGPYLVVGDSNWTVPSDARLKTAISPIDVLSRLKPSGPLAYSFRMKSGGGIQVGTIAQEMKKTFPEIVSQNGPYMGVSYERAAPLALEGVRELQTEMIFQRDIFAGMLLVVIIGMGLISLRIFTRI